MNFRLKKIRIERNLTQKQVADAIKVSRVVYNRYENGTRSIPIEILWDLADLYNETIDYLVGRRDY